MNADAQTQDIRVLDNPERSRFEILLAGSVAGFASYRRNGDAIVFRHTEVDPRFEGHGLGSRLAAAALDNARQRNLAVVPNCPFIAAYIDEHPQYADLVQGGRTQPRGNH